jgi:uncharacterized BrkB/YihY/UPF0761 family membrane protein
MILFTQWSKRGAFGISLLLVFIFTLTTNVVFEPTPVWADTTEEATEEVSGTEESSTGFFGGIMNWINSVTGAVNKMWGMENGSGMAMVVNGLFYLVLIAGTLFVGKMIYNIVSDVLSGKVDEKYQKPSFRKK